MLLQSSFTFEQIRLLDKTIYEMQAGGVSLYNSPSAWLTGQSAHLPAPRVCQLADCCSQPCHFYYPYPLPPKTTEPH